MNEDVTFEMHMKVRALVKALEAGAYIPRTGGETDILKVESWDNVEKEMYKGLAEQLKDVKV